MNKHTIEVASPGTSGNGPEDYQIKHIMRYQKITDEEMQEALKELEG